MTATPILEIQLVAVHTQECRCGRDRDMLVAVDERMVLG
jgi:hypothetical protein